MTPHHISNIAAIADDHVKQSAILHDPSKANEMLTRHQFMLHECVDLLLDIALERHFAERMEEANR